MIKQGLWELRPRRFTSVHEILMIIIYNDHQIYLQETEFIPLVMTPKLPNLKG